MSSHLDNTVISQDNNAGMQHDGSPGLPEIPAADFDFSSIFGSSPSGEVDKVHKRASNVLKLSQENEKLQRELKAMTERLEAAERRRDELARKEQQRMMGAKS